MRMINKTKLQEFAQGLWTKTKGRYDIAVKGATYDKGTQKLTLTKIDNKTENVDLTDLVSKTGKNVITGETLLADGYVLGGVISKLDNQQPDMKKASTPHHMGYKAARVTTSQTLTHITIGIHNDIAVGTKIDGIKVGAIKVSDNTITKYIVDNGTAYVQENKNPELTNCTRSVVITLPQPFKPNEESWFCINCKDAAWGERGTGAQGEGCSEQGEMPQVGQPVKVKTVGYLGKYLLHADKVSLNDIANASFGAVKSVNNQRPDAQGNVTVEIGHINNLQTTLNNKVDNSKVSETASPNKIPCLGNDGKLDTNMIPDLAITSVTTVANKTEAMNLVTNGTIQVGDIVVIRDEKNAIYMYNGQTTGNFDDKFIKLSIGDGTVKTVNGQTPNNNGEVTITADQINLSTGEGLEDELLKRIKTIGGQVARDGNVELKFVAGTDEYELRANDVKITALPTITSAEINEILARLV